MRRSLLFQQIERSSSMKGGVEKCGDVRKCEIFFLGGEIKVVQYM